MKILIIGLGAIANRHIEALKTIDVSVEIYALRSSRNSKKNKGIVDVFSLEELTCKPDFIIISNPTINHKGSRYSR